MQYCTKEYVRNVPGKVGAKVTLLNRLQEQLLLDEDDGITYRQWMYTFSDRTTLVTRQTTVSPFVDDLVEEADQLTIHHYILRAKHPT